MECPTCHRSWDPPCEQAACIVRYGACIVCRYRDFLPDDMSTDEAQLELRGLAMEGK